MSAEMTATIPGTRQLQASGVTLPPASPGLRPEGVSTGDEVDGLEHDLVDELNLRIYPVVVGEGPRLFPEQGPSHGLTLVESVSTPSGVTIQTYRPAGRATFRTVG